MDVVFLLCSAIAAVLLIILKVFVKFKSDYRVLKNFPGTPPTFPFGNISWLIGLYSKKQKYEPGVYVTERIIGLCHLHKEPGAHLFYMGIRPFLSIYRPELLETVLGSSVSIEKSYEYTFLHKWLGTGLLTSKGQKWKSRRKLLTPAFHFRILEDFLPVFNTQSMILVQKLRSFANHEYVDISPHIVLCTLDVICETVMGVSIGAQSGKNSEYVEAIHNLADFFNQRNIRPWLWTDFLFGLTKMGRAFNKDLQILHDFTDKVIKEKKEKLLSESRPAETEVDESGMKKRKAFMDLLLDMHVYGQQLNEADIREEVDTFMFEGHDTTAMGIIFALYCIGLYPKVQEKIMEEINDIFGEDNERPVTMDDTRNMKYLESTLKESQRLFPSVPLIGRKVSENIHFRDLFIPNGITIHCNILGLHRNPAIFTEPEIFDPDRFSPENSLKRHPYAYVPFSAGPRNCIGQKFAILEEKTIICNILRNFKVISLDPRDIFHIKIEFTLRPAQEVRLKFIPR